MILSNFERFFSLLSPSQQAAMDAVCSALREDPTCLDTHHSGCTSAEAVQETSDAS